MTEREALRDRIARHPNAVRFSEVQALLEAYGWAVARVRGSHYMFARGDELITVPYRRPHVLRVYVEKALRATGGQDA